MRSSAPSKSFFLDIGNVSWCKEFESPPFLSVPLPVTSTLVLGKTIDICTGYIILQILMGILTFDSWTLEYMTTATVPLEWLTSICLSGPCWM